MDLTILAAIRRLEAVQDRITATLQPPGPSPLTPGQRYAKALDIARLGVADALVILRQGERVEGGADGPAIPAELEVHYAKNPLLPGPAGHTRATGAAACGEGYAAITGISTSVTCPACLEWIKRNVPAPDVSVLDPAPPHSDVPEPQEGER